MLIHRPPLAQTENRLCRASLENKIQVAKILQVYSHQGMKYSAVPVAPATEPLEVPNLWRLSIDKIAIHIPMEYLNTIAVDRHLNNGPCHFLSYRGSYHVLVIKMAWRPDLPSSALRILAAMMEMAKKGCFEVKFRALLTWVVIACIRCDFSATILATGFIDYHCRIQEWEIAMDFFRRKVLESWDKTDRNFDKGTFYSKKDYKKKRRIVKTRKGGPEVVIPPGWRSPKEHKGTQYSGLKFYDWRKKHGGKVPCERMEFRFQGKYKRYLTPELLSGGVPEAFETLVGAMATILRRVTSPKNLVFNGLWKTLGPWYFRRLLQEAVWMRTTPNPNWRGRSVKK
jgi:hypothetical protein